MLRVKDEQIDASTAQREEKVKTKEKEVAEKYNTQCAHLKKLLKIREKRLHEVRGDLWALEKEHKRVVEAYELVIEKAPTEGGGGEKTGEGDCIEARKRRKRPYFVFVLKRMNEKKIRQEELKKQFTFRL